MRLLYPTGHRGFRRASGWPPCVALTELDLALTGDAAESSTMRTLAGDVRGSGVVQTADLPLIKRWIGHPVGLGP